MTFTLKFPTPLTINVNVTGLTGADPAGPADALAQLETRLMAALDAIKAADADNAKRIQDALDALVLSVTGDFKNTADALAALKAQVESGGTASAADIQGVIDANKASTDAIVARMAGVDIDPTFPAPVIGSGTDTVDAGSGEPPVTPA